MLTVIVLLNLALAVILLYIAFVVWQLRLNLAQLADNLAIYERNTNTALRNAPTAIDNGRLAIQQMQQADLPLDLRLLRLQQLLLVLGVGVQIWQQTRPIRRSKLFKKTLAKYRYREKRLF